MSVDALSCPAPGDCVAAGSYNTVAGLDANAPEHAFIVTESGGAWSDAVAVPGMASLQAIDCPDAGDCVAGGTDAQGNAAVVRDAQGRWGSPAEIPGTRTLASAGKQGSSAVSALACPTAGTCAAGGEYTLGASRLRTPSKTSRPKSSWLAKSAAPGAPRGCPRAWPS
jgi:hypothetical protein